MANRQADDSPRQGNRGIPEMDDSQTTGDQDRLRGGTDEEMRDVADDDVDEFDETEDVDEEEEEDEGSI